MAFVPRRKDRGTALDNEVLQGPVSTIDPPDELDPTPDLDAATALLSDPSRPPTSNADEWIAEHPGADPDLIPSLVGAAQSDPAFLFHPVPDPWPEGDEDPADLSLLPQRPVTVWPNVGPPSGTSGPWPTGWLLVDALGILYQCTTGGIPGTWANLTDGGGIPPGTYVPIAGTGAIPITGDVHTGANLYLDNASGGLELTNMPTIPTLRALQVLPVNAATGSGLVLQGGATVSVNVIQSQILLYSGGGGTNYYRLGLTCLGGPSTAGHGITIDSTFGGTGMAPPITFQMGGSAATANATTIAAGSNGQTLPQATINVASTAGFPAAGSFTVDGSSVSYTGTAGGNQFTGCTGGTATLTTGDAVTGIVHGQNAILLAADASVDITGSAQTTIDGQVFFSIGARIADPVNSGTTRLTIDTRTQSGASNTADASFVSYNRGGVNKWQVGLNSSGNNVDSFDWYDHVDGALRMSLALAGPLLIQGDAPTNYGGSIRLNDTHAGGHEWRIGEFNGAGTLYLHDQSAGVDVLTLTSAAVHAGVVFFPVQAPTASAPSYVKGGMYFDTTLNKLRIGGAAAWETVTSA